MTINYIGQCGFIICTDELALAIDPVLNDLIDEKGVSLRRYPPVIDYKDMNVDYILCTHDHIDHLAQETITQMASLYEGIKFVVPKGCVEEVVSWNIAEDRVLAIADGECLKLQVNDGLKCLVRGISAAHPVHQLDAKGLDHNLAYSIELDGRRLVHLGDTYRTDRLVKDLLSLGNIDVFFPPINGRDEYRESQGIIGNLSCQEAAQLAVDIKAKLTIPTHFDMVIGNTADPHDFVCCLQSFDDKCDYWIPDVQEEFFV